MEGDFLYEVSLFLYSFLYRKTSAFTADVLLKYPVVRLRARHSVEKKKFKLRLVKRSVQLDTLSTRLPVRPSIARGNHQQKCMHFSIVSVRRVCVLESMWDSLCGCLCRLCVCVPV